MPELSAAVIGLGTSGGDYHAPVYADHTDVRLEAVVDPDEARRRAVLERDSVPRSYETADELFSKADIDIVSICSPPQFHLQQARLALEHDTHVLLEKPMTITMGEADDLKAAVERSQAEFCMVHNRIYRDEIQVATEYLDVGLIGDIRHIFVNLAYARRKDEMINTPNHWVHGLPASRWSETLPHLIYCLNEFVGSVEILDVHAEKVLDSQPELVADEAHVTLEAGAGTYIDIRFSANVSNPELSYLLQGSDSRLLIDDPKTHLLPTSTVGKILPVVRSLFDQILNETILDSKYNSPSHKRFIEAYIEHLISGGEKPVTWEEAYRTMKISHEIGQQIAAAVARTDVRS